MYPLTASKVELTLGPPLPLFAAGLMELEVRVHDDVPKSVVFVGAETRGVFSPAGTGFIVNHHYRDFVFHFVVTAAHVLDLIEGDMVSVRMNRKEAGASTVQLKKVWCLPSLKKAHDLAVLGVGALQGIYDHISISSDRDTHARSLSIWPPGLGDEVATVGLYGSHYGEAKNVPVVRIGTIAKLPDEELVFTGRGYLRAFLVETKSFAGLSGSPVYLNIPNIKVTEAGIQAIRRNGPDAFPIGMMLGYHRVSDAEDQMPVPSVRGGEADTKKDLDSRNTGLAVVLPLEAIMDTIESDAVREVFDFSIEKLAKDKGYRETGLGPVAAPPATDENPNHREDFTSLLSAAAKTPPQDD